jgi:D-serine deaminase-like pyridoxal phosphate-dependent protein
MRTPNFLIDIDVLTANIEQAAILVKKHNKKLCPMTKTHKSIEIAKMQIEVGASELLVGTLDEAIAFQDLGVKLVFAYPIVNPDVLRKVRDLRCEYVFSVDHEVHLKILTDNGFGGSEVLIIVDSGLNRLGVKLGELSALAIQVKSLGFKFKGIATHAGQVYKATSHEEVVEVAKHEYHMLNAFKEELIKSGFEEFEICTGTTPTFFELLDSDIITTFRPGNYVFNDVIQVALGAAKEKDCALTVLGSVISNPEKDKYILDVGSKCLGLDKGAHGNSAIKGYGIVKGVDGILESLSEEVSILTTWEPLGIGNIVVIIPNHSCSTCNMTSKLYDFKNDKYIMIDARSNM